jgi:hypothetical protein
METNRMTENKIEQREQTGTNGNKRERTETRDADPTLQSQKKIHQNCRRLRLSHWHPSESNHHESAISSIYEKSVFGRVARVVSKYYFHIRRDSLAEAPRQS